MIVFIFFVGLNPLTDFVAIDANASGGLVIIIDFGALIQTTLSFAMKLANGQNADSHGQSADFYSAERIPPKEVLRRILLCFKVLRNDKSVDVGAGDHST